MPQASAKGLLFIISAPAGTGKTTLVERLSADFPNVVPSISFTTRTPRPNELSGQHYHFVTRPAFEKLIQQHAFLEYVELFGSFYGTPRAWVEEQLEAGNHVILTIDTQGAKRLKGTIPAVFIFIAPPSPIELRRRLELRKTETESVMQERLSWAEHEIRASAHYDYRFVNDNLESAYEILRSIVIAEQARLRP